MANAPHAPLDSPNFSGTPTAPTPGINDVGSRIATTAYVAAKIPLPPGNQPISLFGDVEGRGTSSITARVLGLRGYPLALDPPADTDVLQWSQAAWAWRPVKACTIGAQAGGNQGQIQVNDGTGQFLGITVSGDASIDTTSGIATVLGLRSRPVSPTAPLDGQVLAWSQLNNQWGPATVSASGPVIAVPNAALLSGNGSILGSVALGTNLSVTGVFPNQTLNATGGSGNVTTGILSTNQLAYGSGAQAISSLAAGTTGTVLRGVTGAVPAWGQVNLTMPGGDVTGILAPANLGTGTANNTTYLRGDGTWAPAGGGAAGGSSGQAQWNNASAFAGSSGLTLNLTSITGANMALASGADATGDIYYRAAGGALTRLAPAGTVGWLLSSNGVGSAPSWVAPTGGGNVNAGATLTLNAVVIGQGTQNVATLAALGASGTVLTSNGAASAPSFQVVPPPAAAGVNTQVQYNASGVLSGSSGLQLDPTNVINIRWNLGSDATGDIHFVNAGSTYSRLAIGSAGRVMYSSGTTPQWSSGITLGATSVTGMTMGLASTAVGDIYYAGTAGALTRIAPGTAGYILSTNNVGSAPSWIAPTGGGSGTVVASPQYQIPYYASAGTTASVTGNANITTGAAGGLVLGTPPDAALGTGTLNLSTMLQINANTNIPPAVGIASQLRVVGADTVVPRITIDSFAANNSINLRRAGGTALSPTATPTGANLGQMLFWGSLGATGYPANYSAGIAASSAEAGSYDTTHLGAILTLNTVVAGGSTQATRMTIGTLGGVYLAAASGGTAGDMGNGTLNATGLYVNGTALNPGFAESVGWIAGANPDKATIFINNTGRTVTVVGIVAVREASNTASINLNVYRSTSAQAMTSVAGTIVSTTAFNVNGSIPANVTMLSSASAVTLSAGDRIGVVAAAGAWDTSIGTITCYLQ